MTSDCKAAFSPDCRRPSRELAGTGIESEKIDSRPRYLEPGANGHGRNSVVAEVGGMRLSPYGSRMQCWPLYARHFTMTASHQNASVTAARPL
jgi:hypothetical protein